MYVETVKKILTKKKKTGPGKNYKTSHNCLRNYEQMKKPSTDVKTRLVTIKTVNK